MGDIVKKGPSPKRALPEAWDATYTLKSTSAVKKQIIEVVTPTPADPFGNQPF